jgi:two-component system, OmpR family, response regulator MtrA
MQKKLLVIDDQTGITKVVEMIARQLGLNARSLNSSAQATETFIAFKPDVVMLDMIMPEKDGIDVLNEILLTGIPVKVVLTSGFSDSYLRLGRGRCEVPREPERVGPAQAVSA